MKQFMSGYSGDHKSMFVLPIGDIHFGNKHRNPRYLEQALQFAQKNRARTRILLMGDLLECATKTSVGRAVFEESYNLQEQYEKAVEAFKPVADMIDIVIEGNHEERHIRDTSKEIMQDFCYRIDRMDAYGQFAGIVNFRMATGRTYSGYTWHGATGGTTEASVINAMLKMRETAITHMYFMGHTHKLLSFPREIALPAPGQADPVIMSQLFVNTGASLVHGGYGEQKGFSRPLPGYGFVQLFADEHRKVFHRLEDFA